MCITIVLFIVALMVIAKMYLELETKNKQIKKLKQKLKKLKKLNETEEE